MILGYLGAVLGIRLGHGRGFQYSEPFKVGSKPEIVEVVIPDLLPVSYQKALIMLLTGASVTVMIAILMALHNFWLAAGVLLLSGALKASAYLARQTEHSELLRGLFLGLGVYLALII